MDLAIHIITACCMVGAGVALVFLYRLVYQLEIIIERMNKRVDEMKAYGQNLEDLINELRPKPVKIEINTEAIKKAVTENTNKLIERLNKLNVVDDKPLDFPNGD